MQSLQDDPDARFFVEQNPDFDRFYMLVWAPLDLGDLARGAAQMLRRHVFGDGGRERDGRGRRGAAPAQGFLAPSAPARAG